MQKPGIEVSGTLERAVSFHGHLGPYLVLGILMGDLAIDRLKCKKHFGIRAQVKGAVNKPKSCLVDGLQVSTGCTYGKGNIRKLKGKRIEVLFHNLRNNKKMKICLRGELIKRLHRLEGHRACELFAKDLLKTDPRELFEVKF